MVFSRIWSASCLKVYDQWEKNGVKWIIQDLPPEDDEKAIEILKEHMLPDEKMCSSSGISKDPVSEKSFLDFWRKHLSKRMSLACYTEINGKRTLVGMNVCFVKCKNDMEEEYERGGPASRNVFDALDYINEKLDIFEYMGLDKYLYAVGLIIRREYRGNRFGARLLAAREPLCKSFGIKGTSNIFSSPGPQKLAASCGFETALVIPFKELADAGFNYPRDDSAVKVMTKKYE